MFQNDPKVVKDMHKIEFEKNVKNEIVLMLMHCVSVHHNVPIFRNFFGRFRN